MPPPLNIVVFALSLLLFATEWLITFLSCGYWMVSVKQFLPIKYSLRHKLLEKERQSRHRRRGSLHTNALSTAHIAYNISYKSERGDEGRVRHQQDNSDEPLLQLRDVPQKVCCGCFMKLSPRHQEKNWCENLKNQTIFKRREQYCRHCRHSLKRGDIDKYFELFKHWQLLDEDDKKLLRLRLNKSNICRHCFRSYKSITKGSRMGLNRFQVELEVLSYYVFRLTIWYVAGVCYVFWGDIP